MGFLGEIGRSRQVQRASSPTDEPTQREIQAVFIGLMIVLGLGSLDESVVAFRSGAEPGGRRTGTSASMRSSLFPDTFTSGPRRTAMVFGSRRSLLGIRVSGPTQPRSIVASAKFCRVPRRESD
jgi:hypothetical protein